MQSIARDALDHGSAVEGDDFFEMANLPPDLTGLPMVVWVSQRARSQHAARVKVSLVHGRRMNPSQTTSVSVRPNVEVVAGAPLSSEDLAAVRTWITLNEEVIIGYWDEKLFTNELLQRLKSI